MLQKIIEFSLKNRLIVILLVFILVFLGVVSVINSSTEFLPDLSSPIISVITERPGLAPQEVENLISRQIENSMQSLPDVLNVRSQSTSGLSVVTVTFKWGTDYYFARQLITQTLSEVSAKLPEGTIPPYLSNAASRLGEILQYYVKSDSISLMDLREIADYDIKYRLQNIPGVMRINNMGGEVREYQVLLDVNKMRYHNISLQEVRNAIKASNTDFSGGILKDGPIEFTLRGLGRLHSLKDLYYTIVAYKNDYPIYLKDIAYIQEGAEFRRGVVFVNGKEAVSSLVSKQFGSDTQPIIKNLTKVIEELKEYLPKTVKIETFFNQADLINVSILNLRDALLIGGLSVLIVVIIFLTNFRTTFIIAITIPISVIITFIFMKMYHVTVNVMSLGGLAVGLGIMIDAAIVDTENIFRWIRLHPNEKYMATLKGSLEVRRPIAFSTAIIIVVFAPLMFLSGFEGKLFLPFAFTIIVSMLIGFVLSLTLTPLLCYLLFSTKKDLYKESYITKKIEKVYSPILDKAIKKPLITTIIVLALSSITIILIPTINKELLPPFDENATLMKIWLPPGTSLDEACKVTEKITNIVKDAPDVKNIISSIGRQEGSECTEGGIGYSENYLEFVDRKNRTHKVEEIEEWIRNRVSHFPGVSITFQTPLNDRIEESISGSSGELAVKIFGSDYDILTQKALKVKEIMSDIPGVIDVFFEPTSGLPFINIVVDREKAARYGIDVQTIADAVEVLLEGEKVTSVIQGIKEYKVLIRLQERFRDEKEKIESLLIDTPQGKKIKLSEVTRIYKDKGPLMISRENLQRRVQVTCNTSGIDINDVVNFINSKIKDLNLPQGYSIVYGGNYARQKEVTNQLITIVVISLLVVFMLLIAAFKSTWQAVLLIFTIPLALMGGVWAMLITKESFNVSSLIGFVAHFGLTVQKGVILLEYINDLKAEGYSLQDAIRLAGKTRLRPVLMTAFAASFSVLPLALGIGAGAEIQQPMAIVLIGGLIVSTPVVLIVLPVFYNLFDGLISKKKINMA